ncbi:large exoproteins [Blastochloris viridis]|uniref:Large exoproteins n=1 Tax=Blastochloris viridis TaxID=1079 RepID=A0A182D7H6_BLAVI|nr:large exoproteins [Blastochloris viridis]
MLGVMVVYAVPFLLRGPLLGAAVPWIESSLAERLGPGYSVSIGAAEGVEDADGLTVLKLRDLTVKEPDGRTVATVPLTEIALESGGLFGRPNPRRIDMSGADMVIAINGGTATVSARPAGQGTPDPVPVPSVPKAPTTVDDIAKPTMLAPLIGMLEGIERDGFGGLGLSSIGLRNGTLVMFDATSGRQWRFENIVLSLSRPSEGGVAVTIASGGPKGPWSFTATVSHETGEVRAIDIVGRDLSPKDLLLAFGLADADLHADSAVDVMARARLARDGSLIAGEARLHAGAGQIGPRDPPDDRLVIDEATADLRWDVQRRLITIEPVMVQTGTNRLLLSAAVVPPATDDGAWVWRVLRGRLELGADRPREPPLVLDRILAHGRVEPAAGIVAVDKVEIAGVTVAAAATATLITSGPNPSLQLGMTASRMPAHVVKRLWPPVVAPGARAWILKNVQAGMLERGDIALNSPLDALLKKELPLPDGGMRAEFVLSGGVVQAVEGLPPLRDFSGTAVLTGRTAKITVPHAAIESSGRRLDLADGLIEIPDTFPKGAPTTIRFHTEGPADALAELLQSELLRAQGAPPLDPQTTRGQVSGQVQVSLPLMREVPRSAVTYNLDLQLTGFAADKQVRGQRLEAATVKVTASSKDGIAFRGDGKVAGAPFTFDVRRPHPDGDAEVKFQGTLDDAARTKLGIDGPSGVLTGSMTFKAQGRIGDRDTRLAVEADLKEVAIADLVPGWVKPKGKAAKASFTVNDKAGGGVRFEDLVLEGSGALIKGTVELDDSGDPVTLNLPTFQLSDGDRAALKFERGGDGVMRIVLRGEVIDGRGLIKSLMAGPSVSAAVTRHRTRPRDLDVEAKLGVVVGLNGETARQLDLRMTRRNGELRAFALTGRIGGGDATLKADLKAYQGARMAVIAYATDAGSLLRFVDLYTKVSGGEFWMVIDPPSADGLGQQEGVLNVANFAVRDSGLDKLIAAAPAERGSGRFAGGAPVHFTKMKVEFVRSPSRITLRDGVIWGPQIGATVEGQIDYAKNEVGLRGTFVPAYGLNNLFARIPIVGLFMGGPNEGLLGVTYEVVGRPSAPTLRVNPMSAVAPGFLRKLFEFRGAPDAPPPDLVTR